MNQAKEHQWKVIKLTLKNSLDDSILCFVTTASTPSFPLTTWLTGSRVFFGGTSTENLCDTPPNSNFLALMRRSLHCTRAWAHLICEYITQRLWSRTSEWRDTLERSRVACSSRLLPMEGWSSERRAQSFFPFSAMCFNLEPHSATYIQFAILIRFCSADDNGAALQLWLNIAITAWFSRNNRRRITRQICVCVCVSVCAGFQCVVIALPCIYSVSGGLSSPLPPAAKEPLKVPPSLWAGLIKTLLC